MNELNGLPHDEDLPPALRRVNAAVLQGMAWINGFAHLVLGVALAASVLLFTWLFIHDVCRASATRTWRRASCTGSAP